MCKQRRDRRTLKMDKQQHFKKLSEQKPPGSAAMQMIHKAYSSYRVDDMRSKGLREIGQENFNAAQGITKRNSKT